MGVEIERKYLVINDEWKANAEPTRLVQSYIQSAPGTVVRFRIAGKKAFFTLKGKTEGISRLEYEYEIPVSDAEEIIDRLCDKPYVSKIRNKVVFAGKTWEVDVFDGVNEGLVIAEIELKSEDEQYELPPWAGADVSDQPKYRNRYLSKHPFTTWPNDDK